MSWYCSMNSLLLMFASRKLRTAESVQPSPGKSMIGPYSLRHSVRVSLSTEPSARKIEMVTSVEVIGRASPSTRYDVGDSGSSVKR